ncbi:MAG: alkene reductase [Bdellovibrionales bacterium]|nr:alkene reductase [Bdellovibrionales bacterium]
MKYPELFQPLKVGSLVLSNRILMAPLTRCRAGLEHLPNEMMATYYAQRASAGLLIAEATMIQERNSAFIAEPGIHSPEQVAGWRKVTDAVHREGGRIFLQIWHGGRACHPDMNDGFETVAPSAIAIASEVHTLKGMKAHVTPRALTDAEIPTYVGYYKRAAIHALAAGFDGVEVHGANGYLIDQFLRDGSNKRTGPYGGSLSNRAKFLFDVLSEVISVCGSDRVGLRISPLNSYNSMRDSDPVALTRFLARELNAFHLAYLHLMRADFFGVQSGPVTEAARNEYKSVLIGNMGYTPEEAAMAISQNKIDAVAFGHHFISNPNLVAKVREGRALSEPDQATYYTPGPQGYIDYPAN